MLNELNIIFNWLINFPWEKIYNFFRIVFLVLDFLLIIGFIYVLPKALKFRPVFNPDLSILDLKEKSKGLDSKSLTEEWQKLKLKVFQSTPDSFLENIEKMDNFVNEVLEQIGIKGEHLADKLENLNFLEINSLEKLWKMRKMKNDIIQSGGILNEEQIKEIVTTVEEFLKEIKVIL